MGVEHWSVIGRLKKAVKRINSLLCLNLSRWRLACFLKSDSPHRRLSLSFNDRIGLAGCIEDEVESSERGLVHRNASCGADDDVDQVVEIFISNFRRLLWLERQVSLEMRYSRCRSLESDRDCHAILELFVFDGKNIEI
ncbi:putative pentatricopeptide repeat-containing protein [Hibiscus syriacus]|uniref:Pentatricopeptide repeat-containing protein n=1 Tax=Hibiscus syriacus TaxID=106335 RepID=A0A6A3D3M5_HIBSY|nr:uncharacterized protein LOC120179022 [Hibiscus syriacus]KAE8735194.1 putative pentatricopeptide repeat-containing protein [Hibiscus syriacus]